MVRSLNGVVPGWDPRSWNGGTRELEEKDWAGDIERTEREVGLLLGTEKEDG